MKLDRPRISIGLPVYNGENYLADTLEAILGQTFSNFELIISDNASTDRTSQICRAYAEKDARISYYRNGCNLGAARNFNQTFVLSSGKYFKWAAHDDLIAADYLEKCVCVLDRDPTVVLCYSDLKLIGDTPDVVRSYDPRLRLHHVDSHEPQDRFADVITVPHYCFEVFGLIRADALRRTSLIGSHTGSDRNLLAELALMGRFHQIPEYLFFPRDHSERSIRALPLHARATWFDTRNRGRIVLPRWSMFWGYLQSVRRSSLSMSQRLYCYLHLGNWLRRNGKALAKDLIVALHQLFQVADVYSKESQKTSTL